jgi:hypothetical protein
MKKKITKKERLDEIIQGYKVNDIHWKGNALVSLLITGIVDKKNRHANEMKDPIQAP